MEKRTRRNSHPRGPGPLAGLLPRAKPALFDLSLTQSFLVFLAVLCLWEQGSASFSLSHTVSFVFLILFLPVLWDNFSCLGLRAES